MTENLNVNDNPNECKNTAEGFRKDPGGHMMPIYEEITVMKTEIKEEWCDSEMLLDDMIVHENLEMEYMSLSENNFKIKNLEFMKSTEQSFNNKIVESECSKGEGENSLEKQITSVKESEEPKKYKCNDCKFITKDKWHLVEHIRTHTNYRPFKCTYKDCKCKPEEKETCKCDTCGYATSQKHNLKEHILMKHSEEPKKYKCKDCKYAAHRKQNLEIHMRTHFNERTFKCTYKDCNCTPQQKQFCKCNPCKFATIRKDTLDTHVLCRHSNEVKLYRCNNCKYSAHLRSSLLIHMRTHTNEKPFKCTYRNCDCEPGEEQSCECNMCEYAASRRYALKSHIELKHTTAPKKYKCTDCKYATHIKSNLVRHARIHLVEKSN